jgi:hypothetical protein
MPARRADLGVDAPREVSMRHAGPGQADRLVEDRAGLRRGGLRGSRQHRKTLGPIAGMAHRHIDLERIGWRRDGYHKRRQRAARAEQAAHILRAAALRHALAGQHDVGHSPRGALRRPHGRHRGVEGGAGLTDQDQLSRALAAHGGRDGRRHVGGRAERLDKVLS